MAVIAGSVALCAAGETQRPNILYIICDDLGYGDVHCLNPERGKIPTPNVDRLASQGMVFTDAHGGSSVCTPTRYGVLTGRYAWRSRLQSGVLDGNNDPPLIAADRLTVPALLRQQGYETAAFGKWHLGYLFEDAAQTGKGKKAAGGAKIGTRVIDGPVTRGFDRFFGFSNARTMQTLIGDDRVVEAIEEEQMLPRLAAHTAQYLKEPARSGKPFFIYLALNSPHTPIVPTKEWQGKSGLGKYGDFVMETDWAVGEVLKALDEQQLTEKTIVFFTSDNGCSPAAKVEQLEKQGHYPSARFRGYKADIWDGGHRIPFIVRWPGRIKAGSQCGQLVCLTDLMATCAEITGITLPPNAGEDSVSILPALLGTATKPLREAVVHHSIQGKFAIRQGNWKLELCAGSGGWGAPGDGDAVKRNLPRLQLFDMGKDIGEQANVHDREPATVQQLTKLLEKYIADGRSTPGAPQKNDAAVDMWKNSGP
jgi:arylsulfatase A-like enzyme